MEELVSIITPLYNAEKYIEATINSVQGQTYKNWEMIIVDDCSKDNSYNLVVKLAEQEKRIKLIENKANSGVTKTRNKGIELAKGKYIAFLDADDLWKKEKLEKQISFMKKNKVLISYTGYEKINENGTIRGEIKVPKNVTYHESLKGNIMGCLTVIYNCEKLGKKYFKELKMSEDHVLWLEILKDTDSYGVEESLAQYRVLGNSRSSSKIDAIKFQWEINRKIEKLTRIESVYYFINYLWYGYRRYKV
ncbi:MULTISPECIES: glycosyltransferase family 2 protein [Psychrilyobacter]|uniref:Glycosyltransferase n=1 Tax=Psychrilyobacter piezotolerans TaxID=2293438 RepID=A0ABX9KL81_9FUSO|nr:MULTISPECIES: glycosyltransferase family 2 protein [Psychrilyobacter]MCS5420420.1 glycosyltransferase [Psychrilyobacter sp. S5]NDI76430.1 glycosyltransferase family 2 protein [Psychrilyobacter piezotolerans]RDE66026.1 glycosyltransferase family 2 protein [Psychrilyobacter sp. S5]REI43204.1 glycosyltransferase [Psychrilyobacter piezotolerans]